MLVAAQYSKTQRREVTTYYVSTRERGALHCSIQQAIDKAEPFSRIVLAAGQYFESITVNQPIELVGEEGDPPEICSRGVCVSVNADVECFFEGLHILSKSPPPRTIFARDASSAVRITKGKPTFFKCKMTSVYVGGHSYPTIHHCYISGNIAGCGLIVAEDADGEYLQNSITNHIPYCVLIKSRGTPTLTENTIYQEPKIISAMLASAPQLPRSGGAVLISPDGGNIDTDKSISPRFINNRIGDEVTPSTVSLSCFSKWFPRLVGKVGLGATEEANGTPSAIMKKSVNGKSTSSNPFSASKNIPRKKSITSSRVLDDRSYAALAEREVGLQTQLCERETVKVDSGCSPHFEENHMTGGHASLVVCSGGAGTFSGNNISHGTLFGVNLHPFSSATLNNNVISQCGTGMLLTASNASINSNTISDCIGAGCVLFTSPRTRCYLDGNSFVANDVGLIAHQLHKPPRHVASLAPALSAPSTVAPDVLTTVADILNGIDEGPALSTISKGMICLNKSCGGLLVGSALQLALEGVDVGANGPMGIITAFGAPPQINKCHFERGAVGLLVCEGANPTVSGCRFENHSEAGISVEDHGRGKIIDCDFKSFTKAGVRVIDAGQPSIVGNNFTALEGIGIDVSSGGMGNIERNNFNTIYRGVAVSLFADPVIVDNKIRSATDVGILIHNEGCGTVVGNRVTECNVGIASITGADATIRDNDVGQSSKWGIYCGEGSLSLVEKNKVSESTSANIMLEGADNSSVIRGNLLERSHRFGLHIARGAQATFTKNIIRGDAVGGIASEAGDQCLVTFNSIERCVGSGITIAEGGSSTFKHNDIHNGCSHGIYLAFGSNASITLCNIRDNNGNGVTVEQGTSGEVRECNIHDNRRNGVAFLNPPLGEGVTSRRLTSVEACKLTLLSRLDIYSNGESGVLIGQGCIGRLTDSTIRDHKATSRLKLPSLLVDRIPSLNGDQRAFEAKPSTASLLDLATVQKWLTGIRCVGSQPASCISDCVVANNNVGIYAGNDGEGEFLACTLIGSTFADAVMAPESNVTLNNCTFGDVDNLLKALPEVHDNFGSQSGSLSSLLKSSVGTISSARKIETDIRRTFLNDLKNNCEPSPIGVLAFGTSNGQLIKSRVGNCSVSGVVITGIAKTKVFDSVLHSCNVGIVLDLDCVADVSRCNITKNELANCIFGPSTASTLHRNTISLCQGAGVVVLGDIGKIQENTIRNNSGDGIIFASAVTKAVPLKQKKVIDRATSKNISLLPTPPSNKPTFHPVPTVSIKPTPSASSSQIDASGPSERLPSRITENQISGNDGLGIRFLECTSGTICDNTIESNAAGGVLFHTNCEIRFHSNLVNGNKLTGITIEANGRPVIDNNKVTGNEVANITLTSQSRGIVKGNTISHGVSDGVVVEFNCVTEFEDNTVELHGSGCGMLINGDSSLFTVRANTFSANYIGIHASPGGTKATIEHNIFSHNAVCGIVLDDDSDMAVVANIFDGASCCIQLRSNAKGRVKRNTFTKSTEAIAICGTAVVTDCQDNSFVSNQVGFVLRGSDSAFHLQNNSFGHHDVAAVIIEAGSSSVVCSNVFDGGVRGILVRGGARPWIHNNTFSASASAIEVLDASAVIDKCLFANNKIGVLIHGAINCETPFVGSLGQISKRLLVVDSVFYGNQAGTALRNNPRLEGGGSVEDIMVTRNIFKNHVANASKIDACAVLCESNSPPALFEENVFGDNSHGIMCKERTSCIFSKNLIHDNDVGLHCEGDRCAPLVKDSVFLNNKSRGIHITSFSSPTIKSCLFREGAGIDTQLPVLTVNTSTLKASTVATVNVTNNGGGTIEGCVFRCCSVPVLAEGARNLNITSNKMVIGGCGIVAKGVPSYGLVVSNTVIQLFEVGIGIAAGGMISSVRECLMLECDYGFLGAEGGQCANIISCAFVKCTKYGALSKGIGRFEFRECVMTQSPIGLSISTKALAPTLQRCQDYLTAIPPDSPVTVATPTAPSKAQDGFTAFATMPPDTFRIVPEETLAKSPFAFLRYVNHVERCRIFENKLGFNLGLGYASLATNLIHHNDVGMTIGSATSQDYAVTLHKNSSFENQKMGCTITAFDAERQLSAEGNQFYSPREGGLELVTSVGSESIKQLKENETLNNCAYKQQIPQPSAPCTSDSDLLPSRHAVQRCDELLTLLPPIVVRLFADVPHRTIEYLNLSGNQAQPTQIGRAGLRSAVSRDPPSRSAPAFHCSRLVCSASTKMTLVPKGRPEEIVSTSKKLTKVSPDTSEQVAASNVGDEQFSVAISSLSVTKRLTTPLSPRKPSITPTKPRGKRSKIVM